MKVATWHGGEKFTFDTVADPAPGSGQVVVKIDTVGVCGTDVHITQGLFPSTPPAVLGHEFSGTIVEVGDGVPKSRIGERVACDTTSHCGECENCRTWSYSRCERSVKSGGAFAQYSLVPTASAHRLPDRLETELGALAEPASCCLSGAEMLDIPRGAVGLVIGAGIMGLFTMAFLKARGVETMIVSEPFKPRREMAKQFGADILHDPTEIDLGEVVREHTGGRGVNVAAEAVGKPPLVAKCIEMTRPRGDVLMIGVSPEGSNLPYDLYDLQYREIRLRGAFGRGNVFARTPEAISKLDLSGVISGRYRLENLLDAIHDSAAGKGVKFVIKPWE
jgi:threonine dehydrogenase-like Zn-dependent dehydrogenase